MRIGEKVQLPIIICQDGFITSHAIENKYRMTYMPKTKLPVVEYLKTQGRFSHMFKPGNEWMIKHAQAEVDKNWEELLRLCEL